MIKIKAPEGTAGVSLEGVYYSADQNGFIYIPKGIDTAILMSHGFFDVNGIELEAQ